MKSQLVLFLIVMVSQLIRILSPDPPAVPSTNYIILQFAHPDAVK